MPEYSQKAINMVRDKLESEEWTLSEAGDYLGVGLTAVHKRAIRARWAIPSRVKREAANLMKLRNLKGEAPTYEDGGRLGEAIRKIQGQLKVKLVPFVDSVVDQIVTGKIKSLEAARTADAIARNVVAFELVEEDPTGESAAAPIDPTGKRGVEPEGKPPVEPDDPEGKPPVEPEGKPPVKPDDPEGKCGVETTGLSESQPATNQSIQHHVSSPPTLSSPDEIEYAAQVEILKKGLREVIENFENAPTQIKSVSDLERVVKILKSLHGKEEKAGGDGPRIFVNVNGLASLDGAKG